MGITGMTFLCATRLLAAILVLPFVYISRSERDSWPAIWPWCNR